MSTEPPSPSRLPSHRLKAFTAPADTNMFDYPTEPLSLAQLESRKILSHLLEKLKEKDSRYYVRYGKWVERHVRLEEHCFRCVRPQVWTFLNGRWSLDGLKAIGGDLKFDGRGVYFNGVLGLDKNVRIYIGQAISIRQRVGQHLNFRYRRDNPSLHYHALQHSVYNAIGPLAILPSSNMGNHTLPGMDSPDLLLNLIEMWMCLVFRTLPTQTLEVWLPDDGTINKSRREGKEGEFGGLNIATPLDHGEKEREWLDLSESDDPLIREYLGLGRKLSSVEERKRSEIQYLKTEPKEEEKQEREEDAPVQERRAQYTKRAKSYNTWRAQQDNPSQAVGFLFAVAIGIAIGAALLRSGGGPRPSGRRWS
jgi:hypothetical protein